MLAEILESCVVVAPVHKECFTGLSLITVFRETECTGSSTFVKLPTLLQHTVYFSANEMYCFPVTVPITMFLRFISCIMEF